jgi:hypothetical protein
VNLRCPQRSDHQANNGSEQSRASRQPFDFGDEIATVAIGKIIF